MGDPVDEAAGALPVLRAIWDAPGDEVLALMCRRFLEHV